MPKKADSQDIDWEYLIVGIFPRILAFVSAIALWIISVLYSVHGFGYVSGGKDEWFGWVIAVLGVTSLEIIFNTGHHETNRTLTATCLLAYIYGILSNIVGIYGDWGAPGTSKPLVLLGTIVGACVIGLLVEVSPWLLLGVSFGINTSGRDFISQLAGIMQPPILGDYKPKRRKIPIMTETGVVRGTIACPECGSTNTLVANNRLFCNDCHHQENA